MIPTGSSPISITPDPWTTGKPFCRPLTFEWTAPQGVALSSTTAAKPAVLLDAGVYSFLVVASPYAGIFSAPAEVAITVVNPPPPPSLADGGRPSSHPAAGCG